MNKRLDNMGCRSAIGGEIRSMKVQIGSVVHGKMCLNDILRRRLCQSCEWRVNKCSG